MVAQITMKDIALHFGVSIATVSRALSDSQRISKDRREAIQQYAREHNFVPSFIGNSLRKSTTLKAIGVIVPQINHFYFSSILSSIEEAASKRGYHVVVGQSDEKYDREREICQMFLNLRLSGVIVSQAKDTVNFEHFKRLIEMGMPIVFYDRICTSVNASRVVVDDYTGAYNAVRYLIEKGSRRIAFYGSAFNLEISKNRFNGYRDALSDSKLEFDRSLVFLCDRRGDAEELTPDVLSKENRPDGFFAVNDDTALGILYSAKRMGFRIPEDIQICGFTNGERAISCDPMLTTVEQRGDKVGCDAANMLIDKVEGVIPLEKIEKKVVKTRLVRRGTTRA